MSLTRDLKNPESPASRFLRENFPDARRVMALSRARMGQGLPPRRPAGPVPWSLIGTALDYRLRLYFPPAGRKGRVKNLVCYAGAAKACGARLLRDAGGEVEGMRASPLERTGALKMGPLLEFFAGLEALLGDLPPHGRRLGQDAEDALLRHCVVMGALDVFFRAGSDPASILLKPSAKASAAGMLAAPEGAWLDDLRGLSWDFYENFSGLLLLPAVLNPTFDGSLFVGGADADLIVDGCLIDIKTTINPLHDAGWVYQLLGYALLDWHDDYHIHEVAVYFSRQCHLLRWDLADLLRELSGGQAPDLGETRQQWHDTLTENYLSPSKEGARLSAERIGLALVDGRWKRLPEQF